MGALIREKDWSKTALGSPGFWPQSLRTALSIMLETRFPMYIAWGREFVQFYNDGYRPILGATKHPAIGKSSRETFEEIWDIIGPMFEDVMKGKAVGVTDFLLPLNRFGYVEECYFIFSYSPIRDESGSVGGVLVTVTETTDRVIEERRLKTLRYMAKRASEAKTVSGAWNKIALTIEVNDFDIPFALCYELDEKGETAQLVANINVTSPTEIPEQLQLTAPNHYWVSGGLIASHKAELITNLTHFLPDLVCGAWHEPVTFAYRILLQKPEKKHPYGILLLGINPRKKFNDSYRAFFDLFANHAASALANAHAFEEERKRSEALIEIDRLKTNFFGNISHEFRTPLTLIMGSLENMLNETGRQLPGEDRENLLAAHRNTQRLLKMVNTLLDFSRLEAGRIQARYRPVDITALTEDLASGFRSTIEKAGITYSIRCEAVAEQVYVDPELWEKIVFNLLSNAFKYTLEGEISVSLQRVGNTIEFSVSDTGAGIPAEELGNIFNRFHRVKNTPGRSYEGTGIGLSLVSELTKLHKGSIEVESQPGKGSVFRVRLPVGKDHLPESQIEEAAFFPEKYTVERAFQPYDAPEGPVRSDRPAYPPDTDKLLVVDDNADMRNYICKLLQGTYRVVTATNGREALEKLSADTFQLVLSDIVMPEMDGIELLKRIKGDPATVRIPVILLSARAGEEAMIEGYEIGADDYLIKPFSARELMARVGSQLKVVHAHRHAEEQLKNLFLQAPVALSILRGPRYIVEVANAKMLEIWGKNAESILNRPAFEAMPEVRGQGFEELLDKVFTTGERFVAHELPLFITRNGRDESIYVKFVYEALREEDGSISGIMVLADEVTELVTSRKRIEDSDKQLHNIIQQAPVAMAIYRGPEFVIDVANEKALEFWGRAASEVIGRPLFEVIPEIYEQGVEDILREVYSTGKRFFTKEFQLNLLIEGEMQERYVSFALEPIRALDGGVNALMLIATDITELVTARKRLEDSETRQKLAIDAGEMGTFDLNMITDRFIYTDRMPALFGLSSGERLGAEVFKERIYPDDELIRQKALDEAWQTGNLSYEVRILWPDNSVHWIKVKGKITFDENRYPLRMHGTVMDITERKMVEQQKDDFMGIVSHELKTPVTSMKGYIQMLEEDFMAQGNKEAAKHLGKVDSQIDKLSKLINDLLDVTKIESGKMEFDYEVFDFDQLVDEVVKSMQFVSMRHKLVRTGSCGKKVNGDRNRIEQVIINLISNATKYSPHASEVIIDTSCVDEFVTFSVTDFGAGISSADLRKIFDRFYRVNNIGYKSSGLGLGLFISAEIIKRQGGRIWAESEPGKGSTFYFSLSCLN